MNDRLVIPYWMLPNKSLERTPHRGGFMFGVDWGRRSAHSRYASIFTFDSYLSIWYINLYLRLYNQERWCYYLKDW